MSEVVRAALASVVEGQTLSLEEARAAMGAVMDGEATAAQLAALLVALRMRGETIDELAGFATAMRSVPPAFGLSLVPDFDPPPHPAATSATNSQNIVWKSIA